MASRLVYIDRSGRQREIALQPHQSSVVIGRHPHCDLVTADASVSRRHCEVLVRDGGYAVRDLGSANGTLLNDEPVDEQWLQSRDIIRCGSLLLQFLEEEDELPDDGALKSEPPGSPSADTGGRSGGRHPTDKEALKSYVMHLEDSTRHQQAQIEALERELTEARTALSDAQSQHVSVEGELRALKDRISREMEQVPVPESMLRHHTPRQPHPLLVTTLDLSTSHPAPAPPPMDVGSELLAMMVGEFDDWLESLEALERKVRSHRPAVTPGSELYTLIETLTAELFAHRLAVGSRKSAFLIRAEAQLHDPEYGE